MRKVFLSIIFWIGFVPSSATAEISYLEILKDPDNVELNRQYALERIQVQDIKPALSAIERVIQAAPLDFGARLIRAQILISLGDFSIAQSELELLSQLKLPDEQSLLARNLLKLAKNSQKRFFIDGQLSFAATFNDNVGAHTDSGLIADVNGNTTGNIFVDAEGHTRKTHDILSTGQIILNTLYDLNTQDQDTFYLSFRSSINNGTKTDISDSSSQGITMGINYNIPPLRNNLYFNHQRTKKSTLKVDGLSVIQDNNYTSTLGIKSNYQYRDFNFQFGASTSSENFYGRGELSNASDSKTHSISFTSLSPLSYSTALIADINYAERRATHENLSLAPEGQNRNSSGISFGLIHSPKTGHKVSFNSSLLLHDYKVQNQLMDQFTRRDKETSFSLGYSMNSSALSDQLPSINVDFLFSRSRINSNMATYDITTNTFAIVSTYPFSL